LWSVKKSIVTIRKLCLVYSFMRVTNEIVKSVMLYLVQQYVINVYLLCAVVAVHASKA